MPNSRPASSPSTVLFGEMAGASLRRPNIRPPKYAKMSDAQTAPTTANSSWRPQSSGPGASRTAIRNPSPSPIHATPNSVTASCTVAV